MTQPPEYLPRPEGYEERVASLVAAGTPAPDAHWMAACEAIGAVGRRETNHRDLFWHNDAAYEQRETWDRIVGREAERFYFHQKKDTLVGYLAHGRHTARINTKLGHERQERLVDFIKQQGLWDDWIAHNRGRIEATREEVNQ
ncbi:hypothetical protein [Streptomyces sp. SP17KL33]|uniref:hypothetical protein n=1 Tax=Streptomyces sp. SP17KL33 TaxID=3002534 RepID=UPI002E786DDE|nr:hypothetical protein [Streptomyces sp. SP17KL33]MEE1838087.1 hypothetical protein [Streptomyces sp. SP17KL33]